jgi:iodotyrosine deiodinase
MHDHPTVALPPMPALSDEERVSAARDFADELARRRTVRDYADTPVSREVIAHCLRAAGTAPSGANQQPWRFVAVGDPELKRRIREGAEAEEREFYAHRAPEEWLDALAPLGTDADKPFLETAPWLIGVFTNASATMPPATRSSATTRTNRSASPAACSSLPCIAPASPP